MIRFAKTFAFVLLLAGTAAQAQLPNGRYTGFVSNNAFNEWCRLNNATLDFRAADNDGSVTVFWEETGFAQAPAGGWCENRFDAEFTPSGRENEWDVRFLWNWDLNFGRAVLRGNVLEINATYTGMRTGNQALRVRLTLDNARGSINYDRRIDRWGPTLFANGVLRK